MNTPVPRNIKIYHICHWDRLDSIMADGFIWSYKNAENRQCPGTNIGATKIKRKRLHRNLTLFPDLSIGNCAIFNFCPRTPMLYTIYCQDYYYSDYRGGQEPVVHLEADFFKSIEWAANNQRRWAFTPINAAKSSIDFNSKENLDEINWEKVYARDWKYHKDEKTAEFLMEGSFPWQLIEKIGVYNSVAFQTVTNILAANPSASSPSVSIEPNWYY